MRTSGILRPRILRRGRPNPASVGSLDIQAPQTEGFALAPRIVYHVGRDVGRMTASTILE